MKNSRFFAFLTALFISSLFLSCSSIFESRQGTITVNLPQNNSRAAYEASEIDAFRVEIFQYKNNIPVWTEDFPGTTSSFTSSPLYDGKYVVVIKALKINEDSSTGIIGEGNSGRNKPVELINGKADPVSVIIRMFNVLSDPDITVTDSEGQSAVECNGLGIKTYLAEAGKTYTIDTTADNLAQPVQKYWTIMKNDEDSTETTEQSLAPGDTVAIGCVIIDGVKKDSSLVAQIFCPDPGELAVTQTDSDVKVEWKTCDIDFGTIKVYADDILKEEFEAPFDSEDSLYTFKDLSAGEHTFKVVFEAADINGKKIEYPSEKKFTVRTTISTEPDPADPVDYPVTTNILYVKATGDDSNDGLSAEAPLKTFAKATELAYNNPSTIDTIFIIGTLDNISENNGAAASGDGKGKSTFCLNYELGTETKHFKIIGNKDNHAVLKATGAGTDSAAESSRRVLFVNKQCYVDIEYIDFTGAGNVSGSGAGIYVNPDLTIHLNLTGCKIYGNTVVTEQHGAGIYMSGNNVMNIYDTEIYDNHISLPEGSSAQKGGAAILVGGQLTIHSGSIHDNSITGSAGSMGGGIYVMNGTCTMNGGSFSKNTASYGGAIFNQATFIYNGGYIADDNVGFAERSDGDMNSNAICSTTNIESLSDYLEVIHGKYVCNTAIGEPEE